LMMTFSPMSTRPSMVADPMCGSATTRSLANSLGLMAGSCSNTSRPAPRWPASRQLFADHLAARCVDDVAEGLSSFKRRADSR
jgi:hypothetical protein